MPRVRVSMKDLVSAMMEVSDTKEESPNQEANIKAVAAKIKLKESTVKQRILAYRSRYPHFRLLPLTNFVGVVEKPEKELKDNELDAIFAEVMGKPVKEIQKGVENVRPAFDEATRKRLARKPRETTTAST